MPHHVEFDRNSPIDNIIFLFGAEMRGRRFAAMVGSRLKSSSHMGYVGHFRSVLPSSDTFVSRVTPKPTVKHFITVSPKVSTYDEQKLHRFFGLTQEVVAKGLTERRVVPFVFEQDGGIVIGKLRYSPDAYEEDALNRLPLPAPDTIVLVYPDPLLAHFVATNGQSMAAKILSHRLSPGAIFAARKGSEAFYAAMM